MDDLHNYFPELLYGDLNQFQNVQDVLRYMRRQVQDRHDLYTRAIRNFRESELMQNYTYGTTLLPRSPLAPVSTPFPVREAAPPPPPAPMPPTPPRPTTTSHNPRVRIRTTVSSLPRASGTLTELLDALMPPSISTVPLQTEMNWINLLHDTFGNNLTIPRNIDMTPVIIRPSQQQIDQNTTIEIVDAEEDMCPICQDAMEAGSEARTLNACDHRFHIGCIDTWFQRNVHCPVCRHDVREPAAHTGEEDHSTSHPDLSGNEMES
jgi:hypothetical protein